LEGGRCLVSLIGGCAVSFADLPSNLEGFFGRISTTRESERTRSPDTPTPRLSLIYFWVPRGACLALPWYALGQKPADFRAVCVPNERTNPFSWHASSVPTSLVQYFCLELSCRRRKVWRKSPHIAVSFPSLPLSSPLPSPLLPSALLSVLAF